MNKRKTVFEQVPLAVARKIAAEELKRKEAGRKKSGSKRKVRVGTGLVSSEGASI